MDLIEEIKRAIYIKEGGGNRAVMKKGTAMLT